MFARIAFAVPFGAAVTASLLFMMHLSIDSGSGEITPPTARSVDFVRVEREPVVETREQRPERPKTPAPAPDLPPLEPSGEFWSTIEIAMAAPGIGSLGTAELAGGFEAASGEYLPIVKVAPRYPMRALQRRLEGYVIVEFVVTSSGAVRDVVVIESTSEIFDQAAIEAALRFKYKPRIVDGQPIEVAGVQNRITFRLDA